MKEKKYIVVQARWEKTYWTDLDAPKGKPTPVSTEEAEKALDHARLVFPAATYKIIDSSTHYDDMDMGYRQAHNK